MTDKELNELRDNFALDYMSIKTFGFELGHHAFKSGFDAAIQALKENYVEKARVEKLVEALRFYADKNNWYNANIGLSLPPANVSITAIDAEFENYIGGKRARQAIEEYEK